jgi:hypothetical protein
MPSGLLAFANVHCTVATPEAAVSQAAFEGLDVRQLLELFVGSALLLTFIIIMSPIQAIATTPSAPRPTRAEEEAHCCSPCC